MKWIWNLCYAHMKQKSVRTILTILGVVIGVVSVVSLLSLGIGAKNTILAQFSSGDGVRKIVVTGINEGKRKDHMLTERKISDFSKIEHVAAAYPCLSVSGQAKYEKYVGYGEILGVPRSYLETFEPSFGEIPSEKSLKPDVIMGKRAPYLFLNFDTGSSYIDTIEEDQRKDLDLTGEKLQLQFGYDENAPKAKISVTGMVGGEDFNCYCDIEILKRYLKRISGGGAIIGQPTGENGETYNEWIYSSAIIIVDETENVDQVVKKIQNMGFQTENDKEYLDASQRIIKIVQLLLGGIGMIALIVAVIGICNTMTTSVYDKITEIGMLKVLGCDMDELMYLFLLESGILGGVGGLIGIISSFVILRWIVNPIAVKMLTLEKGTQVAEIPIWLMFFAFVFSVVLGVLAGYIPARWAAKLKPIDALNRR